MTNNITEEYLETKFPDYYLEKFLVDMNLSFFKNWENYNEMIKFNYKTNIVSFLIEIKKPFDFYFFPNIIVPIERIPTSLSLFLYSKDFTNIDKVIDFYCLNKNFILDIYRLSALQSFPHHFQSQLEKRLLLSYNLINSFPYKEIKFNKEENCQAQKFFFQILVLVSKISENILLFNEYPLNIFITHRKFYKNSINRIIIDIFNTNILNFEFEHNFEMNKILENEFAQLFIKLISGLKFEKKIISSIQKIILSKTKI